MKRRRHTPLLIAALLLLCLAAPAARADVAQVTVVRPGGGEQTLALAALAGGEDVVERGYALRWAGGEGRLTVTGFSLAALLAAADVDTFGFSYLEVQRPDGGAVLLSREQALGEGAFADGPPVVYATAAGTGFLRPAADGEDLNGNDSFEAPQGIGIVMRKGSPLRVRARASAQRVEAGEPVRFEAIVERAGSGERLSYSWYFDDGRSGGGARTSHVFRKRGSYDVVLGVTTPGDEVGTSAVVTVQVGEPLAGPDRKGGGRNRAADAPDHGAAAGPATGAGSGGPGARSGGPGSGGGGRGVADAPPGGGGQSPARAAAQLPPAAEPAAPSAPAQPRRARPQRRPEVAAPGGGEPISGELLDPGAAPPPRPAPPRAGARTGNPDGDRGGGVPDAALGALAALGLLGLGALGEAGRLARLGRTRDAVGACIPLGDKNQPHSGGGA